MSRKGITVTPKVREQVQRDPDISSTSAARRYLTAAQKGGTPEQVTAAEKLVSAAHPDMLIDRRQR